MLQEASSRQFSLDLRMGPGRPAAVSLGTRHWSLLPGSRPSAGAGAAVAAALAFSPAISIKAPISPGREEISKPWLIV